MIKNPTDIFIHAVDHSGVSLETPALKLLSRLRQFVPAADFSLWVGESMPIIDDSHREHALVSILPHLCPAGIKRPGIFLDILSRGVMRAVRSIKGEVAEKRLVSLDCSINLIEAVIGEGITCIPPWGNRFGWLTIGLNDGNVAINTGP